MARIIPIETDRLILREYEVGDFDLTHDFNSDPDVVRFLEWGPNRPEDTRRFVEWVVADSPIGNLLRVEAGQLWSK